jgi:hypothetical protein
MIVYSYLASTHGRHNTVSNIHNTYAILQDISYALMTEHILLQRRNILHLLKVSV